MDKITIRGRLTADPELRYTPAGDAVARFTVASNDRRKDASGQWVDGDTLFMPVTAWRQLAEGAADTLRKGAAVVVVGKLQQRSWEKDGQTRSRIEMTADEVGISVRAKSSAQAPAAVMESAW